MTPAGGASVSRAARSAASTFRAPTRALVRSLEKLASLDLYPGHMQPVIGRAREAIEESLDNARQVQ